MLLVKINVTHVNKQKHIPQISVQDLHNNMILPVSQGARTVYGKLCMVDTSLRKYMPEYIKLMSNRNTITCGCKTCISAMLLQSDINKWRLSKLEKLDNLHINYASTRLLERSKIDFIEYNNQIFPND